jgi:hypothetical protein
MLGDQWLEKSPPERAQRIQRPRLILGDQTGVADDIGRQNRC